MFKNSLEVVTVVYTALSLGQDPGTLYSLLSIRDEEMHLFKMLKEKKLTMFPVLQKKLSVRVTEGNPILVYCTCRMPEVAGRYDGVLQL